MFGKFGAVKKLCLSILSLEVSSGHFPYTEILRKPFFNNNHFILVIKFEK